MISQANNIFNNHALYGDCFTQLPSTMWSFTTKSNLTLYKDPTKIEGLHRVDITYHPNGVVRNKNTSMIFPSIFLKWAELGLRRIGGAVLTAFTWAVLVPIGFSIKLVHLVALSALNRTTPSQPEAPQQPAQPSLEFIRAARLKALTPKT